ncbi:MAG: peptidase E [Dehalococcoidia bacterium]|nr:peptidase E [Dehalococcoidia bacterium]
MEPTIVAIGGGSLSESRAEQQIEEYILRLTGADDPRICFIGTASGDTPANIVRFYSVFSSDRCRPSHLTLIDRKVTDLREFLFSQDAIYVGGGNTGALLAIWRQHGLDAVLREAWERGIVLCGSSAGANCWHEASTTDSFGPKLEPLLDGLGFIQGSFCPHFDVEAQRRPLYRGLVAEGALPDGTACDNCVAVRYEGTRVAEFIASKPEARAWRMERTPDGYRETEIVPRYLDG